ncbi:MAG: DNA translocase FtsK, partial [Patescibacteria group bacterium]
EGIVERQKVSGVAGVGLDGTFGDEDDLLEEAKEIVLAAGKASTSLLQRRLRIGYSRAASILDMLEEIGMIGPSNGSKPREILVSGDQMRANSANSISAMPLHNRSESKAPGSYFYQEEESPLALDENLETEKESLELNKDLETDEDEELVDIDEKEELESDIENKDDFENNNEETKKGSKELDDDFGKYFSK